MTIKKSDLVDGIYARVKGTKHEIATVLEHILEVMKSELEQGEKLKITGFGNFSVLEKKERPGRNPQTKEPVIIAKRRVVAFHISKVFKDKLNEKEE